MKKTPANKVLLILVPIFASVCIIAAIIWYQSQSTILIFREKSEYYDGPSVNYEQVVQLTEDLTDEILYIKKPFYSYIHKKYLSDCATQDLERNIGAPHDKDLLGFGLMVCAIPDNKFLTYLEDTNTIGDLETKILVDSVRNFTIAHNTYEQANLLLPNAEPEIAINFGEKVVNQEKQTVTYADSLILKPDIFISDAPKSLEQQAALETLLVISNSEYLKMFQNKKGEECDYIIKVSKNVSPKHIEEILNRHNLLEYLY